MFADADAVAPPTEDNNLQGDADPTDADPADSDQTDSDPADGDPDVDAVDTRADGGDLPDSPPDNPDARPDVDPNCALVDNRCNERDDDCNGEVDDRCCPSPFEWFSTGPPRLDERAVSPRVVWSPLTSRFLIAWIVTTAPRPSDGWATAPSGRLQFAIFDLRYRPIGVPGTFVDEDVSRFDVTETSDGFEVAYAHANPQDPGPDTLLSLVRISPDGAITKRDRVADTNGSIGAVAVSRPSLDRFLIAWTESPAEVGGNCRTPGSSCVMSTIATGGDNPLTGATVEADMVLGRYAGLDLASDPAGGLLVAVRDAERAPDSLVWSRWNEDLVLDPPRTLTLGPTERLDDPHIDPGVRAAARANGNFTVARTKTGPAEIVVHVIDRNGDFLNTVTLANGPAGIRDASVATVPDPSQGALTAWTTLNGVEFKLWNQNFDTAVRTFDYAPGSLVFDHRSVSVDSVPQVGYIAAIAVGTPTGDQIVFSLLGDDLDRLCGP